MARIVLSRQAVTTQDPGSRARAAAAPPLLVLAPDESDRDGLFLELTGRADFSVLFAATAAAAAQALRERPVALLVVAPEVPTPAVTELLAARERLRPPGGAGPARAESA